MEEDPRLKSDKSCDAAKMPTATAQLELEEAETDDFEFAFSIESDLETLPVITADELFYNGRILPVYPVFDPEVVAGSNGKSLEVAEWKLVEEAYRLKLDFEKRDLRSGSASSSSSISSEAEDLNQIRLATPAQFVSSSKLAPQSPDSWRKSSSTGSSAAASRSWKLRDLVVGRSRSEGKERIVVLPPMEEKQKKHFVCSDPKAKSEATVNQAEKMKKKKNGKGKGVAVKEMDILTAHRIYYKNRGGSGGGVAEATSNARRSFLPYRQDLLGGLFGNAKHHHI
ncbi:hypothetical protein HPP92_008139 [Vanilla planifolia]|uniref:Uncharacterized protein n=1 Tax=Vanilla planifolia TaxID=51239 RepID=A0A835V3N1_VANPL|nr:hypothetical protein HPP92_008301 [Vanilla planifolia]KAG0486044.1 hypothetical protein HPP92_008139 [Vanilla planifolia]